jgi:N-acetylglutamate synthase-like GNAT family acetyltransferase
MHIRVATTNDISIIQKISAAVWPKTYGDIISQQQITYMLQQFYSTESLVTQFNNGCVFLIAENNQQNALGFASYQIINNNIFKLHKLYVVQQGLGIGKLLVNTIVTAMRIKTANILQLQVNKYNTAAQQFYKKLNFTIKESAVFEIGEGFIMDDFIMELDLTTLN